MLHGPPPSEFLQGSLEVQIPRPLPTLPLRVGLGLCISVSIPAQSHAHSHLRTTTVGYVIRTRRRGLRQHLHPQYRRVTKWQMIPLLRICFQQGSVSRPVSVSSPEWMNFLPRSLGGYLSACVLRVGADGVT